MSYEINEIVEWIALESYFAMTDGDDGFESWLGSQDPKNCFQ